MIFGVNWHIEIYQVYNTLRVSDENSKICKQRGLDEVTNGEPLHLYLHCLPSRL